MLTPARRHWLKASAAQASAAAADGAPLNATAYELVLLQLVEDRRRLKQVQSVERKIAAKRTMLPAYLPWVRGVLEAGKGAQDDVLMTMMVWAIDIGEIALALEIGTYALAHGLTLPDQFERDVATLLTEEIAERALTAPGDEHQQHLSVLAGLVAERDMPDEVRAKLNKAQGLGLIAHAQDALDSLDAGTLQAALEHLQRAVYLHPKAGVKKDIERLTRAIKHNPAIEQDPSPPAGTVLPEGDVGTDSQAG